jgi:hypothetical protein
VVGKYKLLREYISWEETYDGLNNYWHSYSGGWSGWDKYGGTYQCHYLMERDFDCGYWFVIPEVPIGTVVSLLGMFPAVPVLLVIKQRKSR